MSLYRNAVPIGVFAVALAVAPMAAAQPNMDEYTQFNSPTGNIGCIMTTDYVRCDVRDPEWQATNTDCQYGPGLGIEIPWENPYGPPQFECGGDSAMVVDTPLAYGESVTRGPMQCDSAESGVTCRNTESEHGFWIARDGYQMF